MAARRTTPSKKTAARNGTAHKAAKQKTASRKKARR